MKHYLYRLPVFLFSRKVLGFWIFLSTFFSALFVTTPAFASEGFVNFAEINSPVYTTLDIILDAISIVLMLIAIGFIIKSISSYKKSTIGIAILYFLSATIVLGAIRLTFILGDDGIIPMHDITETTGWHILLCYSAIVFYFAGKTLSSMVDIKSKKKSYTKAIYFMLFSFILSVGIIISLNSSDSFVVKQLQDSWIDTSGAYHILGVVITAFIAIYLYRIKNRYKVYDRLIGSLHIAIGLITAICLWELLNESWRVIIVSDDFGEFIERVLWVPVFIFILYSFTKLRTMSTAEPSESAETSLQPGASSSASSQTSPEIIRKIVKLIPVLTIRKLHMKYHSVKHFLW